MKKIIAFFTMIVIALSAVFPVYAADGKVTYSGNAGNIVFEPGTDHSPTDLFADFKGVMPGDVLTQKITVKNNADDKVKVKIYIRSLGAHEDSAEFLSQLSLKVKKSEDNEMAYMFDAASNETAQLTDWVCLGTLYSGGEVNLDILLSVPVELDNEFQNKIGYIDWEFMIEEFPVDDTDPEPPETGDNSHPEVWITLIMFSCVMLLILLFWQKRQKDEKERAAQY